MKTAIPLHKWFAKHLQRLHDDVQLQENPLLTELLQRLQETEFELEEERDAPGRRWK